MSIPFPMPAPRTSQERRVAVVYFRQLEREAFTPPPTGEGVCWALSRHTGLPCMQPAGHPGRCGS